MDLGIAGKKALVCASSKGLGLGCARALAGEGVNLIMNARHAVDNRGTLSLSTEFRPTARQVIIRIADTGHGIDKKNLSRIFDPFFTTKPTGEGTGLGLSVSYGIIKNHGGDISVDSKVGKGSTFTITLPVVSPNKGYQNAKRHSHRR